MANKVYFVINDKSEMEQWTLSRRKMNINRTVIDSMSAGVIRKCHNVFPVDAISKGTPGAVGLAMAAGQMVARMRIQSIPMTAPFAIEGDMCYPHFDGAHPYMTLKWKTPDSMALYLCVHLNQHYENMNNYLVALDKNMHAWMLPVSNLYADCRLCSGRYDGQASSVIEACFKAWTQFQASKWNADLYGDSNAEVRSFSKNLFKYKIKGDTFEQPTPPVNWQTLCRKVGTQFITDYIAY